MSSVAAWAARHARAVLAISAVLAVAAAVLATTLPTDAGTGTLVDSDTPAYRATQDLRQTFGEDPVVVLAQGDLQQLLLTSDLGQLLRLEGCLSGKLPPGAKPIPGPCTELAELNAGQVRHRAGDLSQRGRDPDQPSADPDGGHGTAQAAA